MITRYRVPLLLSSALLCLAIVFSLFTKPASTQTTIHPNQIRAGTFSQNFTFSGANKFTGALTTTQLNSCTVIDGVTYAQTNAGIQSAINATSAGGCVYLPVATYALTATTNEQIKITNSLHFICAGWGSNLQLGASVPNTIPLLHVVPNGQIVGLEIRDCSFTAPTTNTGSWAIQIDPSTGNNVSNVVIDHINISCSPTNVYGCAGTVGFPSGGIFSNNGTAGEVNGGIYNVTISHSYIATNAKDIQLDKTGDSIDIIGNLLQGSNTASVGFQGYQIGSAAHVRIMNNFMNPNGAAIHFTGAMLAPVITHNEMETPTATTAGSNGAYIDLDCGSGANVCIAPAIADNTFLINSLGAPIDLVRLNFTSYVDVRDNRFVPVTGHFALTLTANPGATKIGDNYWSGLSFANAISDSSASTQTFYEIGDGNQPHIPVVWRAATAQGGQVTFAGFGTGHFAFADNGAQYIYDGLGHAAIVSANTTCCFPFATPPSNLSTVGVSRLDFPETIAPTGAASNDLSYGDSTFHGLLHNDNNGGWIPFPKTVALTADWTCGTGGTVASCTSATIIGSGGGVPLTITLPLVATSTTLQCDGVVGQATGVTANQWNLLTATNGATNVTATYTMATAATAYAAGAVTDQASTTTTFQIAPSWTLGAITTKMPFHIWAKVEGASASGTVVSLQLLAPTVGDLVTIYRGTACTVF